MLVINKILYISIQQHISCTAATVLSDSLATIGAAVQTFVHLTNNQVIENLNKLGDF